MSELKDIAIVGSGHTKFGQFDNRSLQDLIVEASQEAIKESHLEAKQIDQIFLGHFNADMVDDAFPSSLALEISEDLRFTPATRLENACASGSAAISAGINAILAGRAETVLVIGAEKMSGNSTKEVTIALAKAGYSLDEHAGLSFPQLFALAAQQYEEAYASPLATMAHIAVKNQHNAMVNPLAQLHREMDFDFCNTVSDKNPEIAPPLRLTDCSLISDGAAAIIITKKDLVKSDQKVAYFKAFEQVNDYLSLNKRRFIDFEGPARSMQQALKNANFSLDDISFAEVHDCFTIAELLVYEAMGITEKGQGHRAIDEGVVYRDGKLPVNLSGGLKAKGHPVGATGVSMHAITYRQLTGQAGEMQLDQAKAGLIFNMGGSAVANYSSILTAE